MNIKLDKRSEALLKEMLRKNSRYGSVDLMLKEAVEMFHASERKTRVYVSTFINLCDDNYFCRLHLYG